MPENQFKTHKAGYKCFTIVGKSTAICQECTCRCIKYGMTKAGKQRFQCLNCKRTFQIDYKTSKLSAIVNYTIKILLSEGCSIRSISRILKISTTTIIRRIKIIACKIKPPAISKHQIFELDELYTFVDLENSPEKTEPKNYLFQQECRNVASLFNDLFLWLRKDAIV